MTLTYGSLFSGAGGMDLGLERAGLRCAWQVEINPYRRKILQRHWPHVQRHDDVQTFPPSDPDDWRCDIIVGGFPCKNTSTGAAIHGKRSGLNGPASGLWWAMHRIINCIQPSRVIVENVSGVSTWASAITAGLADSFYAVRRLDLSAADVGAPHLRRRVFFAADVDRERLALTWPEGSPTVEGEPWRTVDGNPWLSSLAGVLRVDDGIPAGLDRRERINALGDAVCPAVAEYIGRRILAPTPPTPSKES
jgi:DNA (cytosine-5)-methyltransferase 1